GPVDGVHGDVHRVRQRRLSSGAVHQLPDLVALEQAVAVVLLALADLDDAGEVFHAVEAVAHRLRRGLVGFELVAAADPRGRGDGGGFGDTNEVDHGLISCPWRVANTTPDSRSGSTSPSRTPVPATRTRSRASTDELSPGRT